MEKLYLLKIGEIALKGKNRNFFERKLRDNIRSKLKDTPISITGGHGRYYLSLTKDNSNELFHNKIKWALETTFGLTGYAQAIKCQKDFSIIKENLIALIKEQGITINSFKVNTRRSDKDFPLDSNQINCELGELILDTFNGSVVDIHNPKLTIYIEIREECYIYLTPKKTLCGLPVGVAGRGSLMLSGGIDSPVAGWMMAKRGLKLDAIYFHAYPYTSDEAKEKVISLAKIIAPYLDGLTLFVINFTDIQMEIKRNSLPELSTVLMRSCMMEIADRISTMRDNQAIVTGEALSQVASQTTYSLRVTSNHTDYPILRPCIGLDKEEIINIAKNINTFETSILPHEDCCSLFSPKHPVIKPNFNALKEAYKKLNVESLYEKSIKDAQISYIDRFGEVKF